MMITKLSGMFCTAAPVSANTADSSVAFAHTAA